ncbi:hypothetical protein TGVEG_362950 [Toxoplasma gondii VEG]|uniref:Uncharacterized protein n=1 Tax=Toxoplasma gondii (strain ATCC 50861 / VEG) TaxID=432359 RepID=V5B890_TOXGV|nr:hypothetical protein TGVEG_362950 [Toxoplasma gondii VEG]
MRTKKGTKQLSEKKRIHRRGLSVDYGVLERETPPLTRLPELAPANCKPTANHPSQIFCRERHQSSPHYPFFLLRGRHRSLPPKSAVHSLPLARHSLSIPRSLSLRVRAPAEKCMKPQS